MGEMIRHRFDRAAGRSLELVNVRSLSENDTRQTRVSRLHYHCPVPEGSSRRIAKKAAPPQKGSSRSPLKSWWNDPERKRQRRISSYKYYAAEANVKRSLNNGLRWLRKKCSLIIHAF